VQELAAGPLFRFADWPDDRVPRRAAGVYTVWRAGEFLYAGMSGRGAQREDFIADSGGRVKAKGLWTRLNSHASGRRSGDQFNLYVRPVAAFDLDQDTLARRRRVLGEDHPDTLLSARHLAEDREALDDAAES
jgi:hypothetical protein